MKAEATSYQRLREHLSYLGLTTAAENLSGELKDKLSATQVLETLLEAEVVATKARRARGRLRFAHFPVHKTLTNFDFDFQPTLDRKLRFLACWVTQASFGSAVQLASRTRRVARCM